MSKVMIQKEALAELEKLKLNQHEHESKGYVYNSRWTCNQGNSKTYEVCKVLENYTAKNWHDLSYVIYRVWNAVKAIFNRSDWQKMSTSVLQRLWNQQEKTAQTLSKALTLNWKNGEMTKIEGPKFCEEKKVDFTWG